MKTTRWILVVLAALSAICNTVLATPLSMNGDIEWLSSPPSSLRGGALTSTAHMFGFTEREAFTLTEDIIINGVGLGVHDNVQTGQQTIEQGTTINSYFIHAELPDNELRVFKAEIQFGTDILGVIFNDEELNLSDLSLGAEGTLYPVYSVREFDPSGSIYDFVTIGPNARTITINLQIGGMLDELRIITASSSFPVPEPATFLLFGAGLAGFGRRTRQ